VAFDALTTKLYEPAVVGVPEMVPLALICRPFGRAPLEML